jgi:hypothetical protein
MIYGRRRLITLLRYSGRAATGGRALSYLERPVRQYSKLNELTEGDHKHMVDLVKSARRSEDWLTASAPSILGHLFEPLGFVDQTSAADGTGGSPFGLSDHPFRRGVLTRIVSGRWREVALQPEITLN